MALGTQPKGAVRGGGGVVGEGGLGLLVKECSYSSTNLVFFSLKKKNGIQGSTHTHWVAEKSKV